MKAKKIKDKIWVQWKGKIFKLSSKKSLAKHSDNAMDLVAPFPCKILKIHVQAGQFLKKGEPVLVVEAMKMEYAYNSPLEGTVEKILVREGMLVPEGTHFVEWKKP